MALITRLKPYWRNHTLPVVLLTVLSGILLLSDLGDGYLWQDEAQSALISRTVLNDGVPKATDGKNTFGQVRDAIYGPDKTWRYHPWLHFYTIAGSFAVLGESTLSARLPAALAGIGSVIMLYLLGFKVTCNRETAFIAGLLLTLSVAFLLLTTQCRYYGLSIFFSVAGAHTFFRMIHLERYGFLFFVLSTFLLFHSHFIYCATLFLSLLVYTWFLANEQLKRVISGLAIVTVLNIPAIIWYGGISQKARGEFLAFSDTLSFLSTFWRHIDQFLVPGALMLLSGILAIVGLVKTRRSKGVNLPVSIQALALPVFFSVITIVVIAVLVHKPYFRYIGPVIPFLLLLMAMFIRWAMQIHSLMGVGIILIWLATGDLKSYGQQMTTDYYGPMEGITQFLNQYGKPSDTVAIPYGDLPVKFYTDLHVIGASSNEDYRKALDAKWIILRKYSIMEEDAQMKKYLMNNLDMSQYRQATIDYPDIPFQNREVLDKHHFKPVRNAPKIRILKRVDTTDEDGN